MLASRSFASALALALLQPTQGAYYYHYSATDGWPTPEDALKAVKKDTDARGIPVRYAQWDDWWYSQKGGDVGGLLEWQPRKAIFPSGLTDWLAPWKTSLYVAMYSPGNIYAKPPYSYKWKVDDTHHALPMDQAFYDDLFANGSKADMVMFEQDFLCTHNVGTHLTNRDVTTGDTWFRNMDAAAQKANVSLQFW